VCISMSDHAYAIYIHSNQQNSTNCPCKCHSCQAHSNLQTGRWIAQMFFYSLPNCLPGC
jgi:hypothetical protein